MRITPYSAAADGQLGQAVQLAPGLLVDLFRQSGLVDLLAQLVDLGLGLVGLAQLVLDGLHLLAKDVLPLALIHLRLDLVLDLGAELQHFQLPVHEGREAAQALGKVDLLEQFLLVFSLQTHGGGYEVAERRRVVDVGCRQLQLVGQVGHQLDDAGVDRDEVSLQRLELGARHDDVGQVVDRGGEVRLLGNEVVDLYAPDALGDDAQRPVGGFDHLLNGRQHADSVHVGRPRLLDIRPLGRDQADLLVAAQDVVDEIHGARLAYGERGHGVGEDHRVFQGQYGQQCGGGPHVLRGVT